MKYEDQLKKKIVIVQNNLRAPANALAQTLRTSSPALKDHINRCNGILFDVEDFRASPIQDEFRNKITVKFGKGYDYKDKTVGFVLKSNNICDLRGIFPVKGMKSLHYDIIKGFETFVRRSKYPQHTLINYPTGELKHAGYWYSLMVRSTQDSQLMVAPSLYRNDLNQAQTDEINKEVIEYFTTSKHNIQSIYMNYWESSRLTHMNKYSLIYGKPYIYETLLGYKFRISPASFFQLNSQCAEVLYETVREMAQLDRNTVVVDICCGTGTIGILLSKYVKRVIGIEAIEASVKDAERNAKINGVTNADFFTGRAEKLMHVLLVNPETRIITGSEEIVAIVNPGRAGLGQKVTRAIRRCEKIKRVVYISCKTNGHATQNFVELCMASCKKMPNTPFMPGRAVPVDMFPHTRHTELVVTFER